MMANICVNPSFELLNPAGTNFPLNWQYSSVPANHASVTINKESHSGGIAIRMAASPSGIAQLTSDFIAARKGTAGFYYKAIKSSNTGKNLTFKVSGVTKVAAEIATTQFTVPAEHTADGQWHRGAVSFDYLTNTGVDGVVICMSINSGADKGDGDWLVDDVDCTEERVGANSVIEAFTIPDLVLRKGKVSELVLQIANMGDTKLDPSSIELVIPSDIKLVGDKRRLHEKVQALDPGSSLRMTWSIMGTQQNNIDLTVNWTGHGVNASRTKRTVCVSSDDPRLICTTDDGSWRLMTRPKSLQAGNNSRFSPYTTKKSSELPDSMMGVTAHLPRSRDFEQVFDADYLIDGDWSTSWSGRAHTTPVPGTIDWVQLDLRSSQTIREIHLIPYWHSEGFPKDFVIHAKIGTVWQTIHTAEGVALSASAGDVPKQPLVISLSNPVRVSAIRIEATRLTAGSSFFTDCAVANYMRFSEIELINDKGVNVALATNGTRASVSSTYYSYFNTADVIRKTYPMVYDLGVKWNRIGFWGDMTTWAQVEREKGKYTIDPDTDRAIRSSVKNGVNILYCLCWGNRLYESTPWQADPGPVWRASHPFTGDGGPTTDDAIQGFVNYAKYVARHFKGIVKHWEIWNEENSWAWYGSPPDPKVFGTLVRETAKALKQIDPDNYVIFGGTAAIAPTFLEEALEKGGAGPYIDAISYHPYTMPFPEGCPGSLDIINGKQVGKGQAELGISTMEEMMKLLRSVTQCFNPKLELWADEWCPVPTREDTPYPGCSELTQAKYIARFFLMGTLHHVRSVYYCMYSNTIYDQGILRVDLSKRPLFYTIQAMTTLLSGATPDTSIQVTASEGAAPIKPAVGDLSKLVVEAVIPPCNTIKVRFKNIATFMELSVYDSSVSRSVDLARSATASSSSMWDGFGPEKGNDGDITSRFSAKTVKDEWYELEWSTSQRFDTIVLHQWSTLLHQQPILMEVWDTSRQEYVETAIIGGAVNVRCEAFRGRNHEALVAVWYPVASSDDYPGKLLSLKINIPTARTVEAIDPLHLVSQHLTYRRVGDQMVIDGLDVKDYPLFIRIA